MIRTKLLRSLNVSRIVTSSLLASRRVQTPAASRLSLLSNLAAHVSKNAAILEEYLQVNNLPHPSFSECAPIDFLPSTNDQVVQDARIALASAAKDLHQLAIGPKDGIVWIANDESYLAMALHVLCEFGIAQKVPIGGSIRYDDLAADSDLDKDIIMRFVKTAASHHYFYEPDPSRVSHTVASKLLATEEGMRSFLWQRVDEQMPMTGKAVAALKQDLSKPQENAFKLTHGHHFYTPIGDHTRRFGHLMRSVTTGSCVRIL